MTDNASLPANARLPINRCNLPAKILGSLRFAQHPAPLLIDGVAELHRDLFQRLDPLHTGAERAQQFMDYMTVHFLLEHLDEAGLTPGTGRGRGKADYLRLLRGWLFNPDGREAAVLKGWVESRFGLITRYHEQPIADPHAAAYRHFLEARADGLYNTNALEAQLDLVFTFCQYELRHSHPGQTHLTLYRGVNHEALEGERGAVRGKHVVLLNNLNSFSDQRERADEFGDFIMEAEVPLAKVFFYNRLLPGQLQGEGEYMVLGGLYPVRVAVL